ncbi:gliding motility-associated C-terminal domain-containing protein, partial [Maribacter algicola]
GDTFDNDDLFARLGGSPDAGGTWTDNGDGTHTYTVLATSPCTADDSSTVTVTQQVQPNAGTDGVLNICQGDTFDNDDLFARLGGSPDAGGTWTDNGDGTHTYTVLATAPCTVNDTSSVTVVEQTPPNAGSDGSLNICQGDTFDNNDLFAHLGGSPDTGGTWTDNGDGTHTYTVLATAPCTTDDSSTVTVSTNQTDSNNNGIADCTETIPVQLIINIDPITADNIINEQESLETITITGNASGDFNEGDIVTLSLNNTNYTGAVDVNGIYNISVSGNDLVSDNDNSVLGTITTINSNGNTGSASVQHPYIIDTQAPLVESFTTTDTFPILLGYGSPNEILTITVAFDNSGSQITYVINTDIDGIWAIDTSTEVPQNGSFPTIDDEAILSITATDIAGNTGIGEVIIIFENEPLTADSDNDGLPDDEEVRIGTDPNNPDTDGDGIRDGQEVSDGTDPLDPCDSVGGTPPSGSTCELYVELDIVKPGDNINGNFEIINIEMFPNNSVQIYNRWGVKVWETKGYENNTNAFNGISNGRTTIMQNEELPSGVYYYDIQYEARGEQKLLTGYLYVIR